MMAWPPGSHDITLLDFFLWRYLKARVYATKIQDIQDLQNRISIEIATVPSHMLQNVWREIDDRLDTLRATNGASN